MDLSVVLSVNHTEREEGRNAVPFNCYQIIKLEQKKKNITDGVIGAKLASISELKYLKITIPRRCNRSSPPPYTPNQFLRRSISPFPFWIFLRCLISRQPNSFYNFHFHSVDFAASPIMEAPDNSEATVPYNSPKLAGTVNWGTATVVGVFAGMLYGGSKEAAASVSKDAEVMLKLGSTEDKREQYRLMRDAMEKRFIRVTRGSIVGGVRLGIFTAAFYCLQNLLAEKRGVHDVFNVVGAGSATASAFGLIMPGSLRWRARNMALGSVLGAAFCFPLGWIHLKLVEMANEGNPAAHPHSDQRQVKSGVSAAIERLEGNLSK